MSKKCMFLINRYNNKNLMFLFFSKKTNQYKTTKRTMKKERKAKSKNICKILNRNKSKFI